MRKMIILVVTALLVLGIAAVSFAETNTQQNEQIPAPERYEGDYYERMWEFCHGENGMMNRYFDGKDSVRGTQNQI